MHKYAHIFAYIYFRSLYVSLVWEKLHEFKFKQSDVSLKGMWILYGMVKFRI